MKMVRTSILYIIVLAHIWAFSKKEDDRDLSFYMPKTIDSLEIIDHTNYILGYSEIHEQAAWVLYSLDINKMNPEVSRKNDFRSDPLVSTESAHPNDYKKSGFDRGHLSPAADNKINEDIMSESFFMSNMSPQKPYFNRGVWRMLEERVRKYAEDKGPLIILTAGVLQDSLENIGTNEVSIPEYYYKVIYATEYEKTIGFLLKNESSSDPLESFMVTVDSIESITKIDFFVQFEDLIENKMESDLDSTFWKIL